MRQDYLTFGSPDIGEEEIAEVVSTLRSGWIGTGPKVAAFEEAFKAYVGAEHAIAVSSCSAALHLSMLVSGVGPGDEVITTPMTFCATANAIVHAGATPVFADIDLATMNIDPERLEAAITPKTKAIIPVHLFGQSAEMDAVMALAREHNLRVIEDGAQAIGARYRGRGCGSMGDFGTYSFFPSKNLGGFGDGGMVVCNDDALAEQARILRMHGSKPKYFHREVGGNFRLDPLQAALLRVKLRRYGDYTRARQENAAYYTRKLSALQGVVAGTSARCCCAAPSPSRSSRRCGRSSPDSTA